MSRENPFEKMNGATEKTKRIRRKTYLAALQSAAHYNAKLLEIRPRQHEAAFHYAHELAGVKSPTEMVEITPGTPASSSRC
jgi:hypothetical protein